MCMECLNGVNPWLVGSLVCLAYYLFKTACLESKVKEVEVEKKDVEKISKLKDKLIEKGEYFYKPSLTRGDKDKCKKVYEVHKRIIDYYRERVDTHYIGVTETIEEAEELINELYNSKNYSK